MFNKGKILLVVLLIYVFLSGFAAAGETTVYKIGVLAKRGPERCLVKWTATADYLTDTVDGAGFEIVPLDFKQIYSTVGAGQVDFIITNPSFYVGLELLHSANRIATLKNLVSDGNNATVFGGVIFCRSDRQDIRNIIDLKKKTFMAVKETSFGGWQTAWRELKDQGIDPYKDFADLQFGGTHDAVVHAVADGRVDAGTVRTDTLERMAAEDKIDLNDLRIIYGRDEHKHHPIYSTEIGEVHDEDFPLIHSTRMYPEWTFAKILGTDDEIAEKVSVALLSMSAESVAARAAKCAGWTIPYNYSPVHECLKKLRAGPYKDYGKITTSDMIKQYWHWILGTICVLGTTIVFAGYISRLNRKLNKSITKGKRAEYKLQESKAKYEALFEFMSSGVAVYEAVGNGSDFIFVDFNQAGEKIEKIKRDKLIGKSLLESFPGVKEFGLFEVIQRVWDTGESEFYPIAIYRDEKNSGWRENYVYKLPSGEVVTVYNDVTERKLAEAKIKEQQYYLEKAQELGHIGTWKLDLRRNRLYWTDENCRIFGVPVGSVPNCNAFMAKTHPDDREYVDRKWNAAIRGELYDIEHRILVDGVTKWVRGKAEIEYDKDGTAISAIGFTQDITRLKHAKEALQKANTELEQRVKGRTRELAQANEQLYLALQKWRDIFQAIGQPSVILDSQHRVTAANRATVRAAGKSEKELIGKNCYELFHGTDHNPQDCPMAKELISTPLQTVEIEMEIFGGSFLVSCTPVFDDAGNLMRIIHIATDITGRKQAEKKLLDYQRQLRRLSADLTLAEERERRQIATLLHDNITQTLVLFKIKLGLFRENELREEASGPFTEIYELLDDIIQDTRTLTFDLSCPILYELGLEAAIRDLLETEISQKHEITTEFQTDGQQIYLEDDLRVVLYRAVKELFLNVVKHAGAESIKFSTWKDKNKLWLRVEDDGVGLKQEPDDIKYSRAGGFGLFNIYERLEQFGGHVEIESEQGRGTQVTLAVPV